MNKYMISKESGLPGVADFAKFSINSYGKDASPRLSKEAMGLFWASSTMFQGDITPSRETKTPFFLKSSDQPPMPPGFSSAFSIGQGFKPPSLNPFNVSLGMKPQMSLRSSVSMKWNVSKEPPTTPAPVVSLPTPPEKEVAPSSAPKQKKKRGPRKNRKDVHCKKVLRACRKYYQDLLSKDTEYILRKRARDNEFFHRCLIQILKKYVPSKGKPCEEMVFYLGSLVYHKDTSKNLDLLKPKSLTKKAAENVNS